MSTYVVARERLAARVSKEEPTPYDLLARVWNRASGILAGITSNYPGFTIGDTQYGWGTPVSGVTLASVAICGGQVCMGETDRKDFLSCIVEICNNYELVRSKYGDYWALCWTGGSLLDWHGMEEIMLAFSRISNGSEGLEQSRARVCYVGNVKRMMGLVRKSIMRMRGGMGEDDKIHEIACAAAEKVKLQNEDVDIADIKKALDGHGMSWMATMVAVLRAVILTGFHVEGDQSTCTFVHTVRQCTAVTSRHDCVAYIGDDITSRVMAEHHPWLNVHRKLTSCNKRLNSEVEWGSQVTLAGDARTIYVNGRPHRSETQLVANWPTSLKPVALLKRSVTRQLGLLVCNQGELIKSATTSIHSSRENARSVLHGLKAEYPDLYDCLFDGNIRPFAIERLLNLHSRMNDMARAILDRLFIGVSSSNLTLEVGSGQYLNMVTTPGPRGGVYTVSGRKVDFMQFLGPGELGDSKFMTGLKVLSNVMGRRCGKAAIALSVDPDCLVQGQDVDNRNDSWYTPGVITKVPEAEDRLLGPRRFLPLRNC